MSIFEYDEKLHEKNLLEEGIEIGEKRGIQHTITLLRSLGHDTSEIGSLLIQEYGLPEENVEIWSAFHIPLLPEGWHNRVYFS